jgi:hypothetical protein
MARDEENSQPLQIQAIQAIQAIQGTFGELSGSIQ